MRAKNKKSPIMFLVFLCCSLSAIPYLSTTDVNGDTHTALSCSQTAVQNAINSASDGDTVIVPAGTGTWTTVTSITPAVTIDKKAITLIGAGIGQTIIYDATTNGYLEVALYVNGVEGKPFRISGFTFYLSNTDCTHGILNIGGNCKNLRVDHCKFDHVTGSGRAIYVSGYGVIDHCTIVCPADDTIQGISPNGEGSASWTKLLTLGTSNALYMEDCNFNFSYMNDNCIDAANGANYVFRNNTVTNTFAAHHGTDSGGHRAPHSFEIYNNTLNTTVAMYTCGRFRGGTGVVFNNTFTGPYAAWFIVSNYRSCVSYDPWGKCDGTNPLDGNEEPNGYPCLDQIGRTTLIEGTAYQPQKSEPLYEWNNTLNGADLDIGVDDMCPEVATHIKENRDYYNDTQKSGYTPYTYPHPLTVSDNPPTAVRDGTSSTADFDFTYSTTTLSANWDIAADNSVITKYWYAIGTILGATNITNGWISNNTNTSVTKTGLTLTIGTTYYFSVKVQDIFETLSDVTNSDGQYVVKVDTADTTPPSNMAVIRDGTGDDIGAINAINPITELSANWDASTDTQSGIAKYWYKISSSIVQSSEFVVGWTNNGLNTSVTKTGLNLTIGVTYYFSVKAENGVGLQSSTTTSDGQYISGQLVVSSEQVKISNTGAVNITANSAGITWQTNKPATSQVQYGVTEAYDWNTNESNELVTSHIVFINSLTAGTTYHFRAISRDAGGVMAVSPDNMFLALVSNPIIGIYVYPNPCSFTGDDTVRFHVNDTQGAEISIYAVNGKLVRKLAVENGKMEKEWDGRNENGEKVTKGIYIYKIALANGDTFIGKVGVIQ